MRLPVLALNANWVALAKPPTIAMREHPWSLDFPNLDTALNAQLQKEKPELLRLGASCFGSIYNLDPEHSGVALFGINRSAIASLREQYGDGRIRASIHFITQDDGGTETRIIDAPLLPHNTKPKIIPSTAKGKKCRTEFSRIACAGDWCLWEANVGFARPHQIRAHAALAGIPIMGDFLYGGAASPNAHDRGNAHGRSFTVKKPLFDGLAAHLHTLELPQAERPIAAPRPRRFEACLRRLKLSEPSNKA
ncbi:MAG: Ribosomal large subunit pseudouridine synthase C [Opitutia bacterium UBA7350]|nr:MAG: Ribosomal large subunit pseudouridine synthase C [Opitutae bacterium UBA7350]